MFRESSQLPNYGFLFSARVNREEEPVFAWRANGRLLQSRKIGARPGDCRGPPGLTATNDINHPAPYDAGYFLPAHRACGNLPNP